MEHVIRCPKCSRVKLYVNQVKRVGFCQYCKDGWSPADLNTYGFLSDKQRDPTYTRGIVSPPPLEVAWRHREAREYLLSRAVSEESAPNIFYDPVRKRLYFRIWSPSTDLPRSWHTRGIASEDGWRVFSGTDKQHYLYGVRAVRPQRVVVVEGIFDQLRLGSGSIALMGTYVSPTHMAYLRQFGEVVLWLDPDEAGRQATEELKKRLASLSRPPVVRVVSFEQEPGDMPPTHPAVTLLRKWLADFNEE